MDHKSYRLLKEAAHQTAINHAKNLQEEAFWKEVKVYANKLVAEGHNLNGFDWEDIAEMYLDEIRLLAPGQSVKDYDAQKALKDAETELETKQKQVNVNRRGRQVTQQSSSQPANSSSRTDFSGNVRGGGTASQRAAERAAEREVEKTTRTTNQRRSPSAQNNLGKTQTTPAPSPKPTPSATPAPSSTPAPRPTPTPSPRPTPVRDRMATASKADRMAAWAKANPKLANKTKTANPLMSKFKTESVDQFDIRFNELFQKGLSEKQVLEHMCREGMVKHEEKQAKKEKNKKKIMRVEICPSISEEFLEDLFDQTIIESLEEGADLSDWTVTELWEQFLQQIAADPELVMELRRSEKEGKGSPEERMTVAGKEYLVGKRAERKRKGEKGGRHQYSGGQSGAEIERGRKKGEKYSQDERLNRKEKGARMLALKKRREDARAGRRPGSNYTGD